MQKVADISVTTSEYIWQSANMTFQQSQMGNLGQNYLQMKEGQLVMCAGPASDDLLMFQFSLLYENQNQ